MESCSLTVDSFWTITIEKKEEEIYTCYISFSSVFFVVTPYGHDYHPNNDQETNNLEKNKFWKNIRKTLSEKYIHVLRGIIAARWKQNIKIDVRDIQNSTGWGSYAIVSFTRSRCILKKKQLRTSDGY